MKILEIENNSDFTALKDRWNDLLPRSGNTIFSTWEWISTWWRHFGKEKSLRILVAEEKDAIVSIAPLMLSKNNLRHFGKIRKIEFIGGWDSDYNDFIFVRQDRDCLKLFLNRLIEFSDWDSLDAPFR